MARDLQERALTIELAVYGSDHPEIAGTQVEFGEDAARHRRDLIVRGPGRV